MSEEEKPFFNNALSILNQIKKEGFELVGVEYKLDFGVNKLIETSVDVKLIGYIDAVFKKGEEYLLVDWKTNKDEGKGSIHRQQLALYKKAFAIKNNLDENQIRVGLAYIGLREIINDGKTNYNYNQLQPSSSAIETITGKLQTILSWKQQPELFIEKLQQTKEDGVLARTIKEQLVVDAPSK